MDQNGIIDIAFLKRQLIINISIFLTEGGVSKSQLLEKIDIVLCGLFEQGTKIRGHSREKITRNFIYFRF